MTLQLGKEWAARPRDTNLPVPEPVSQVMLAIAALREGLENMPAPVVKVEPQDLSDIVTAVQGLNGPTGVTPQDIAAAVRDVLVPALDKPVDEAWQPQMLNALEKLNFRLQGLGAARGGGPSSIEVTRSPALTDTQLRATPVPVSGTVSTGLQQGLTRAELDANPVQITGNVTASGASLNVSEALNFTSHNLQSAALSQTTNISNDYLASKVELHFTTRAARTVTLTTEDGTVLRKISGNTSLDLDLDLEQAYFEGGEQLTLAITQTSSACLVTGKLTVAQGELALSGNPTVSQGSAGSEPWPISSNSPLNVRAISRFYNIRGQRYIASTDYVPLSLNTSNQVLALFQNPAGSGQVVLFEKAEFGSTTNTTFTRFGGGTTPLVGTPTAKSIGRTDGGTSSSTMKLYTGGNGAANARGTTVAAQFSVSVAGTVRKVAVMQAYEQYKLPEIDGTLVLQPGQQSYWVVDEVPGGGSGTFNGLIDFEWVEIPTANWAAMVTALQAKSEY